MLNKTQDTCTLSPQKLDWSKKLKFMKYSEQHIAVYLKVVCTIRGVNESDWSNESEDLNQINGFDSDWFR